MTVSLYHRIWSKELRHCWFLLPTLAKTSQCHLQDYEVLLSHYCLLHYIRQGISESEGQLRYSHCPFFFCSFAACPESIKCNACNVPLKTRDESDSCLLSSYPFCPIDQETRTNVNGGAEKCGEEQKQRGCLSYWIVSPSSSQCNRKLKSTPKHWGCTTKSLIEHLLSQYQQWWACDNWKGSERKCFSNAFPIIDIEMITKQNHDDE